MKAWEKTPATEVSSCWPSPCNFPARMESSAKCVIELFQGGQSVVSGLVCNEEFTINVFKSDNVDCSL